MLVLLLLGAFGYVVQTGASNFTDTDKRQAAAQLSSHIQNLSICRQKIPPGETAPLSPSPTVKVDLEVYVTMVLGVDDTEQTMSTLMQILVGWKDEALAWNASDHANLESLEIATSSFWTPDIKVISSLSFTSVLSNVGWVTVYSDGSIFATTAYRLETTCRMDHTLFPYDTQACQLRFQPMSTTILMNVTQSGIVQGTAARESFTNQWDLTSVRTTSQFTVSVHIKRKSLFYSVCLFLPLVLTCYMNTLVFLVPLQSGEKISFLVSIFVFNSVFISFFNDIMPRGLETIPVTMALAVFVIVESFVVLVITLIIMSRHHSLVQKDDDVSSDVSEQDAGSGDHDETSDGIPKTKYSFGSESIDVSEKKKKKKIDMLRMLGSCSCKVLPLQDNEVCDDQNAAVDVPQASDKEIKRRRVNINPSVIDRVCFVVFFCLNCLALSLIFEKLF